eukprot:GHUV01028837.1.p1 GENE.GHUV01028837.1~~GHUV01028837.1.p1  ORF type:complete len:381 (+),score=114.44 GHUV01028837.1:947-2089(+)
MDEGPAVQKARSAGVEAEPGAEHGHTSPASLANAAKQGQLVSQVFISHTGQDQHAKTFAASILKPFLERAGLKVFMDFTNLKPGCPWPAELKRAAAHSAVFVAVLSVNYTFRPWCMVELDLALHGDGRGPTAPVIIPVFYDSPDIIVKWEKIQEHWQANMPAEWQGQVDPRRWANNVVAMKEKYQNLRRRTEGAAKDEELQLAQLVVATAVQAVPKKVHIGADLVGYEQQEAQLLAGLALPDEKRHILWIHGPGGLGKSTMARQLYNRLTPRFLHSAFVELPYVEPDIIHDRCSMDLSKHLVSTLQQLGAHGFSEYNSAPILTSKLMEYVRDRDILLVLDNVWTAQQLDNLLPQDFGSGSCLVITSRDREMPQSDTWRVS